MTPRNENSVFIVGGGPAGLAAAIAARRKGFSVTVADAIVPPADKACGEGLMPDALAVLAQLGVPLGVADSFAFRGIRFINGGNSVDASFPAGFGLGVRRTLLHRIMAEYAESVGVELRWGEPVDFDALPSGWIIGADGENSLVRKWAGLDARLREVRRFGFRRHYRVKPWTDCMELYWGDACQVYVTPVADDSVCVAAISRNPQLRLDDALRGIPDLAQRLSPAATMTAERGAVSATRKLKAVFRGRVALIGDASGSVDAITGEGLQLAFRQAVALAEALESGDLATYQRKHRRIARRPEWMGSLLLAMGDHARVRHAAMRAMSRYPGIFARMLAIHVGAFYEIDNYDVTDGERGAVWPADSARTGPSPDTSSVHAE